MARNEELIKFRKQIRRAVANYMRSEGCSCRRNIEEHRKHKEELGKLLGVPEYGDKSGYDFFKFKDK